MRGPLPGMVKWVGYNMHVAMQKPLPMMEYRDKSGDDMEPGGNFAVPRRLSRGPGPTDSGMPWAKDVTFQRWNEDVACPQSEYAKSAGEF